MEYVEGTDLARLLKERGPLPVAQACDYARQAALGLQHAHERGLVHRDIKPSNLLVTTKGAQVKVLDLGLARLDLIGGRAPETQLTEVGAVMGTPDYIAPEQALDTRQADQRADIYSLGCTLYHLLTGQPPFPDGTLAQKLLRHQQTDPAPVESLRADLPAGLALVVRKMMAKHPRDRYQTAGEVAGALELFARYAVPVGQVGVIPEVARPPRLVVPAIVAVTETVSGASAQSVTAPVTVPPLAVPRPAPSRRRLVIAAAGLGTFLVLVLVYLVWQGSKEDPATKGLKDDPFERWLGGRPKISPDNRYVWQTPKELVAVLGEDRAHHWGAVHCLALSADGKLAASGGDDQVIRLWDPETMTGRGVLTGHTGSVPCLAFSVDRRLLLSNATDGTTRVWDVATGKELRQFADLPGPVSAASFAADGETAFTAAPAKGVMAWEVKSGKRVGGFGGPTVLLLFAVDRSATVDNALGSVFIQRWQDAAPPRELKVLLKEREAEKAKAKEKEKPVPVQVTSAAATPNGSRILFATSDGMLRLWDVEGNKELHRFRGPSGMWRTTPPSSECG